ncbi:MAG: 30S ribosomal protein S4 [Planctomycetota bacterium]|nr:MAG: 30S ribosomal protein S4 [Planctomycetota bacterium]
MDATSKKECPMARYRGPRVRILRRLGTELPGLTTKTATRRPTPPGHAAATKGRFTKLSEHGMRLREKQKLRFHYGLSERALRRIYERASRMPGDSGRNMLTLLESRLDNLVWRAGITRTVPAARQLITHGHVRLNGLRAKTPSQFLKSGDVFALADKCLNREDLRVSVNNPVLDPPPGLSRDLDKLSVTVETTPGPDQLPIEVNIQKVIEFYAR